MEAHKNQHAPFGKTVPKVRTGPEASALRKGKKIQKEKGRGKRTINRRKRDRERESIFTILLHSHIGLSIHAIWRRTHQRVGSLETLQGLGLNLGKLAHQEIRADDTEQIEEGEITLTLRACVQPSGIVPSVFLMAVVASL